MSASTATKRHPIHIRASDVSGQKTVKVAGIDPDSTIGELVEGLVPKMHLPANDGEGRPISYHVRLEREGRHLHASEITGEVLQSDDQIVLQPNIMAGGA